MWCCHIQSLLFVRRLVGALCEGYIADHFGKQKANVRFIFIFPNIAFLLASSFVDYLYGWMVRFFIGWTNMASITVRTVNMVRHFYLMGNSLPVSTPLDCSNKCPQN